AGFIAVVTPKWPIPRAGLCTRLRDQTALASQPSYVREAARRVYAMATSAMHRNTFSGQAKADFTNMPNVVRGFDGLGRNKGESQVSLEYMNSDTAFRISVG